MKPQPSEHGLLACAVSAARAAGNHALRNLARRGVTIKAFKHDVKLRLDLECQEKAEKVILARFPRHRILGEEGAAPARSTGADGAFEWIIDPIDGTVNFSHGLQQWCCSIAVRSGSAVLAGAVYAPALGQLYTATSRRRSTLNDRTIRVSGVRDLRSAMVLTGLDKNVEPRVPPLAMFEALSNGVQKTRIMGSAALDLCQVAAGRADGYFESGIYIWDVAAAGLIVEQAGGKAGILKCQSDSRLCFLASNGLIHAGLKRLVSIRQA